MDRFGEKKVFIFSVLLMSVFVGVVLPYMSGYTESLIGTNISPDTSFFVLPKRLYEIARIYGSDGRRAYIVLRFTFDLVWPCVYLLFFVSSFTYLGMRKYILPILGVVFDLLENITASILMGLYPKEIYPLAYLFSIFNAAKWVFITASFIMLIVLLIKKAFFTHSNE